jgi:hypothetical protein
MNKKTDRVVPEHILSAFGQTVKVAVIPDDDEMWDGKKDPTQFNSALNRIEVKASYDMKNDPEKWIVHEITHAVMFSKGVSNYADPKHQYPTNEIEQWAYTTQFYHFAKDSIDLKEIMTDPKYNNLKQSFERHPEVLNSYFNNAVGELTRRREQEQTDLQK